MFRDFNEIICLGMGGSYSEIAKDKLFKAYDLYLYQRSLNTIRECIEYVDEFSNAIAVLPVETSYKGIIRETIDNLILTKNHKSFSRAARSFSAIVRITCGSGLTTLRS